MALFGAILNLIYAVAGLCAFGVFLVMRYYAAGVFAFAAAVMSGVTSHLNWLHTKGRLNLWYEHNELDQFFWIGFWSMAFGSSGFVYHVAALIIIHKFDLVMVVASIWGFILIQSGSILMYYAHKYSRDNRPTLLATEA